MTIELKQTKKIEVTFPCYRRTEFSTYWAVIDKNKCIQVDPLGLRGPEISHTNIEVAWCVETSFYCTEEDFMDAYQMALYKLTILFTKEVANV